MLHTPNAGQKMLLQCFFEQKSWKKKEKAQKFEKRKKKHKNLKKKIGAKFDKRKFGFAAKHCKVHDIDNSTVH